MSFTYLFALDHQIDIEDGIYAKQVTDTYYFFEIEGEVKVFKTMKDLHKLFNINVEFPVSQKIELSDINEWIIKDSISLDLYSVNCGINLKKYYEYYLPENLKIGKEITIDCPCTYYYHKHYETGDDEPRFEMETIHVNGCKAENCEYKQSYKSKYY